MRRRTFMHGVGAAGSGLLLGVAASSPARASDDPLAKLVPGHPRLLIGKDALAQLASRRRSDARLDGLAKVIEAEARRLLGEPPVVYRKIGRRLLDVSRTALGRTLALGFAYQVTRDTAFARRAEREMLAAAAFTDWNPSHFLDVGEMTAALAFGYDWTFDALSAEARATVRQAILEKGLRPGLDPKASHNGWQSRNNNWNQVCFGGLTLGALAIADEAPDVARQTLALARAGIGHGLEPYAPDGIYPEGPGYWSYGTSYQVVMIAALESAIGTDWDLSRSPGFLQSAAAQAQVTAPSGLYFNFSDCREPAGIEPALFWLAGRAGTPGLLAQQAAFVDRLLERAARGLPEGETRRFLPLAVLFWPQGASQPSDLPRFWAGRGTNPIAVFRSSWSDAGAVYLALKGGSASLNHAHMDAGSFVLEASGVRWARDLGMQEYESLESKGVDLWNRSQDSERWRVFRLNSDSHNTLTIDGRRHRVDGNARLVAFSDRPADPFAVVDLSPVFAGQATRVLRGFRLLEDRSVLVQDELRGAAPGASVRWAMVTGAEVAVDGASAQLREKGKTLEARLLSPASGRFSVVPADPPAGFYDAPNPDRRILLVTAPVAADGTLRIAVSLGPDAKSPELRPIEAW
jgi:hypothetical protein